MFYILKITSITRAGVWANKLCFLTGCNDCVTVFVFTAVDRPLYKDPAVIFSTFNIKSIEFLPDKRFFCSIKQHYTSSILATFIVPIRKILSSCVLLVFIFRKTSSMAILTRVEISIVR